MQMENYKFNGLVTTRRATAVEKCSSTYWTVPAASPRSGTGFGAAWEGVADRATCCSRVSKVSTIGFAVGDTGSPAV